MDQTLDQPTQQPEWFENFIANYDTQSPQPGQFLQGTVIRIDQEGIFLDLGLKREILVPARDLEHINPEYLSTLATGSLVPVFVVSPAEENKELEISLSRGLEQQTWEKADKSLQDGEILTLDVIGHNRGGLIVRYEGLRGFIPFSLVPELRGIRNPKRAESIKNGLVNTGIEVKLTEVDRERRRLIFSAEAAQEEKRIKRLESFKKGQVVHGRVVKVVEFGAFVDLGGIDGLIHISQLAWKKVKHPSDVLKVGDEVDVKIIEVDLDRKRIGLSRKALLPGPWQTIGDEIKAGDYVEGIVTRMVDFGAFVKLPQGVEGLIHSSQIGYSSHQDPQNAIKPGDKVLLKVLEVKPEKKRVALSMRQVPVDRQISWSMGTLEEESEPEQEVEQKPDQTVLEETTLLEEPPPTPEPPALSAEAASTEATNEEHELVVESQEATA